MDIVRNRTHDQRLEGANGNGEGDRDLLQRLQADFVNYKQRAEREREEQTQLANEQLILRLLSVLDDFSRALGGAPEKSANNGWVKGIALIEHKLRSTLEEEGLSMVEAAPGVDFDPWEHEAVLYEESPDYEEGKIKAVLKDGYKLYDKVIRPAQVAVSKGPGQGRPRARNRLFGWRRSV